MVKRLAYKITASAVGVLWLIFYATVHLWPASFWMEVNSVRVTDATTSTQPLLYVDRTIKGSFQGAWSVTVKQLDTGTTTVACAENATVFYEETSKLPDVITLGWWTNGTCTTLPKGNYVIDTVWDIKGNILLPHKQIRVVSNVFTVQ